MSPAVVDWTQPTSYVVYKSVHIDNTNIATTINNLYRFQIGAQTTINNSSTSITNIEGCSCVGDYVLGITLSDLRGTGNFGIPQLAGVLVRLVDAPAGTMSLEGNPPYIWNLGWVSISNADGMLAEKRVTRDALLWFPAEIHAATQLNYYARPGVTIELVELLPA